MMVRYPAAAGRKKFVAKRVHRVVQHRSGMAGVEAMTMLTEHVFPRHAHDQLGIGVMTMGAQRSWSGLGDVESGYGDVIMVNPGEMHDGMPLERVRGWHIVYLDPGMVRRELTDDDVADDVVLRPVARDPYLAQEIIRLIAELGSAMPDGTLTEEALLCCLMRAFHKHGVDGPVRARMSPPVNRAIQLLEDAPAHATALADLAAVSGISRFQLLRGFFRQTGATPHAYLVQLRVRLARRYLASGTSPVEAALSSGFADQSHLTRAFRRQFGVTPGRYQAAIR